MQSIHREGPTGGAVTVSRFRGASGVEEAHLVICPGDYGSFTRQLEDLRRAYHDALESMRIDPETVVVRRFFCSDIRNQAEALRRDPFTNPAEPEACCAISWAGQPPMPPARIAMWAYHVIDPEQGAAPAPAGPRHADVPTTSPHKTRNEHGITLHRGELSHHWTCGLTCPSAGGSYDKTHGIFADYNAWLERHNLTLKDHVLRTWLFVDDIDAEYHGLVVARREFFARCGLTPETHFIASSGIGGVASDPATRVTMDAYAVGGLRDEQIHQLAAPDHLSPTHVYGVTFERGTAVDYRDRRHVIISGTASIDANGDIVHPGDVARQLDRTLENVDALLSHAGAAMSDMCHWLVYVRDPADLAFARTEMRRRFKDAPVVVLAAPVCRPGWLIEVEGMAIAPADNPALPPF